jgi:hypothetical protein
LSLEDDLLEQRVKRTAKIEALVFSFLHGARRLNGEYMKVLGLFLPQINQSYDFPFRPTGSFIERAGISTPMFPDRFTRE